MKISGTTGIDLSGLPINNSGNTEVEGNLNITGTGKRITGDFSNETESNRLMFQTSTLNNNTFISSMPNGTATTSAFGSFNSSDVNNSSVGYFSTNSSSVRIISAKVGTGTVLPITFWTNSIERMRIDTDGNVLVNGGAGLGYGTGAGGAVTQLTSKGTAVTLNKPTGTITMNNAALAAGTYVEFGVSNSIITNNDTVKLSLQDGFVGYRVEDRNVGPGGMTIRLTNITGGSLSQAVAINFTVIKGGIA